MFAVYIQNPPNFGPSQNSMMILTMHQNLFRDFEFSPELAFFSLLIVFLKIKSFKEIESAFGVDKGKEGSLGVN